MAGSERQRAGDHEGGFTGQARTWCFTSSHSLLAGTQFQGHAPAKEAGKCSIPVPGEEETHFGSSQ